MITPEYLEKLKELCEKATPGPWRPGRNFPTDVHSSDQLIAGCNSFYSKDQQIERESNAAFIAESRVAIPLLIEALEKCTDELKKCKEALQEISECKSETEAWVISNECLKVLLGEKK